MHICKAATSEFIQVDSGGYDTVALRADGTVWAWGYNECEQLGDGTNQSSKTPVQHTVTRTIASDASKKDAVNLDESTTTFRNRRKYNRKNKDNYSNRSF